MNDKNKNLLAMTPVHAGWSLTQDGKWVGNVITTEEGFLAVCVDIHVIGASFISLGRAVDYIVINIPEREE